MLAALERGVYEEQKFLEPGIPGWETFVAGLEKSGMLHAVARGLGLELDERKLAISRRQSANRRRGAVPSVEKGVES
jgi:hypothetical protein